MAEQAGAKVRSKYEPLDRIESLIAPQRVNSLSSTEHVKEFKGAMQAIIEQAQAAIAYAEAKVVTEQKGT